eukprot:GCRY01000192.1.p1 GENE.GCRY01000192.1~~GCRY01000192.1.p1  ORF type:complete len:293 (+),score=61.20 GCRY01000192.1:69-947(+)
MSFLNALRLTKPNFRRFYSTSIADKMKVFIVYAHENKQSYNHAMVEKAVEVFKARGDEVKVSDLYEMKFNPVISCNDMKVPPKVGDKYNYVGEAAKALVNNNLDDVIVQEHDKLKWADLVIYQFPMQWFSAPAILRGWIDKVYLVGSIYGFSGPVGVLDKGGVVGKKLLISCTTGGPGPGFSPAGFDGDMNVAMWPLVFGLGGFVGFDTLKAHVTFTPGFKDEATRKKDLEAYGERLKNIENEECVPFPKMSDFDFPVLKKDADVSKFQSVAIRGYDTKVDTATFTDLYISR